MDDSVPHSDSEAATAAAVTGRLWARRAVALKRGDAGCSLRLAAWPQAHPGIHATSRRAATRKLLEVAAVLTSFKFGRGQRIRVCVIDEYLTGRSPMLNVETP